MKKISDVAHLTTKAALSTKAAEVESKILDITNLATKVALNTKAKEIENKITDNVFIMIPRFKMFISNF